MLRIAERLQPLDRVHIGRCQTVDHRGCNILQLAGHWPTLGRALVDHGQKLILMLGNDAQQLRIAFLHPAHQVRQHCRIVAQYALHVLEHRIVAQKVERVGIARTAALGRTGRPYTALLLLLLLLSGSGQRKRHIASTAHLRQQVLDGAVRNVGANFQRQPGALFRVTHLCVRPARRQNKAEMHHYDCDGVEVDGLVALLDGGSAVSPLLPLAGSAFVSCFGAGVSFFGSDVSPSAGSSAAGVGFLLITTINFLSSSLYWLSRSSKDAPPPRPVKLDDAFLMTKFGLYNLYLIAISGTVLAAVLLETLGISYVLPVAECDLLLTTKEKGVVSAISFAGIICSSHLWGFLADTRGRRAIIMPTLFLAFASSTISSLATNFWLITVMRFFTGFFISGPSATIYAYLGEFHGKRNCSRAIMGASFVFGVGSILLPLIAWSIINQEWEFTIPVLNVIYRPWRLFLVVCSLPSLISALALLRVPESPKYLLSRGREAETVAILHRMYRWNSSRRDPPLVLTGVLQETEAEQTKVRREEAANSKSVVGLLKQMWQQTAPLFMGTYLRRTVIICVLQFGIYLTSSGMYMFFPDILNRIAEQQSKGVERITTCNAVYATRIDIRELVKPTNGTARPDLCHQKLDISAYEHSFVLEAIYAIGFAVIGLVINAVGRLPILLFVFALCGTCGILIAFIDLPLLAIWFYLILLSCGFAISVVNACAVDLFPTNLRLGSIVGSNLVGFLLDTHCELTFWISGLLLIGCGVLSFFIPNIYKRKPSERFSVSSR
uniref:Major facilitator superfamily (MFS) profile domain-containing protein n=1 Tax=Anopheles culicifacies TaxID=139723 RepID=A0A182MMF2_9DIPT